MLFIKMKITNSITISYSLWYVELPGNDRVSFMTFDWLKSVWRQLNNIYINQIAQPEHSLCNQQRKIMKRKDKLDTKLKAR